MSDVDLLARDALLILADDWEETHTFRMKTKIFGSNIEIDFFCL